MTARFIVGDSLTVLRSMPDASVDLVLTSPPFLALRSYLPADHPDKSREVGAEANPGEFVDTLLDIVEECRRVLAPHGSLVIELGDSYSGSGGSGGDYLEGGSREGQAKFTGTAATARSERGRTVSLDRDHFASSDSRPGWPLAKSLCLVPELLRIALVYGFNPLTGRETPRWRARNVVRWCRPNPPVGQLHDKFRPGTSDMVVACTNRRRYFDLDAVRQPLAESPGNRYLRRVSQGDTEGRLAEAGANKITADYDPTDSAGAPPLDWWAVPTEPYRGSHYATWPTELLKRPILAMCPHRVCTTCGRPSERLTEKTNAAGQGHRRTRQAGAERQLTSTDVPDAAEYVTLGWTDCGHDSWRQGVVLDPFAGSGTTLAVATGHGRDAIGIDLDERNADLARQRVGMFLEVEHRKEPACPAS